jgi:cytidine deaminase
MDLAYAPYSNFQVGSAALTESGLIYGGSNQENASYPLTMCSERNAMYRAALSAPGDKVMAVAITARSKDGMLAKPVMPCGACRQVLLEFEERYERDLSIYVITADDTVYIMQRAKDLLPLSFDKSYL